MGSQDNDGDRFRGRLPSQNIEKLRPVHSGHLHIQDNQVKALELSIQQAHRFQTIARIFNLMACHFYDFMNQKSNMLTVFNDQNVSYFSFPLWLVDAHSKT